MRAPATIRREAGGYVGQVSLAQPDLTNRTRLVVLNRQTRTIHRSGTDQFRITSAHFRFADIPNSWPVTIVRWTIPAFALRVLRRTTTD